MARGRRLAGRPRLQAGQARRWPFRELPRPVRLVGESLNVGKQFGQMLRLIDNQFWSELGEEAPGIVAGEIPLIGRLQIGILVVVQDRSDERGLAGLSRTGDGYDGKLLNGRLKSGGKVGYDQHGRLLAD